MADQFVSDMHDLLYKHLEFATRMCKNLVSCDEVDEDYEICANKVIEDTHIAVFGVTGGEFPRISSERNETWPYIHVNTDCNYNSPDFWYKFRSYDNLLAVRDVIDRLTVYAIRDVVDRCRVRVAVDVNGVCKVVRLMDRALYVLSKQWEN